MERPGGRKWKMKRPLGLQGLFRVQDLGYSCHPWCLHVFFFFFFFFVGGRGGGGVVATTAL